MTQLHTYAEARLGRWSQWYHWGKRPGPARVISWWGPLEDRLKQRAGHVETPCPVDVPESEETQLAVMALEPQLRAVVFETYIKGGTIDQKMRALGIGSTRTYYKHLQRAYIQLLGFFNDIAAGVALPPVESSVPVHTSARRLRVRSPACAGVVSRLRIA